MSKQTELGLNFVRVWGSFSYLIIQLGTSTSVWDARTRAKCKHVSAFSKGVLAFLFIHENNKLIATCVCLHYIAEAWFCDGERDRSIQNSSKLVGYATALAHSLNALYFRGKLSTPCCRINYSRELKDWFFDFQNNCGKTTRGFCNLYKRYSWRRWKKTFYFVRVDSSWRDEFGRSH